MTSRLKVGILLDSNSIPVWARDLAGNIAASDHSVLSLVVVDGDRRMSARPAGNAGKSSARQILRRFQARLDRLYARLVDRHRNQPDAWRPAVEAGALADVPKLQKVSAVMSADELDTLRAADLDVLLHCGLRAVEPQIIATPRLGVWSILNAPATIESAVPAGFWPAMRGDHITRSVLSMTVPNQEPLVLFESFGSTSRFSVHDNISRNYAKGKQFILRMLCRLGELGDDAFLDERRRRVADQSLAGDEMAQMPSAPGYAFIVARAIVRKCFMLVDNTLFESRWTLRRSQRLERGSALQLGQLLPNPPAVFRADPHFISVDGKHYLFIEEYCYNASKGHISVQECDSDGEFIGDMVKILDRPYHLSYPFVFEHDGSIYLVPESSANKTIEIYKATNFPHEWEHQQDLLTDIDAADATLLFEGGKWWLFTNVRSDTGVSSWDELFLFVSDDLWSGEWRAHPLNPIVSDCRTARPAGAILRRDGKLIRPSQQSNSRYGAGLNFFEITVLTETQYEETLITRMNSLGLGRNQGIHSYAERADFAIVDENVRRFRFFYSR